MIALVVVAALVTLLLGYAAYRNVTSTPYRGRQRAVTSPPPRGTWGQRLGSMTQMAERPWVIAALGLILSHLILVIGWLDGYVWLANLKAFWIAHFAFGFFAFTSRFNNSGLKAIRALVVVVWVIVALTEIGGDTQTITNSVPKGGAWITASPLLPVDVALPIIAACESGERQGAVGKYQILAALHEKRAHDLGLDLNTEEGSERYARHLYAESGTRELGQDPRSKACWEPKLAALLRQPELAYTITVPAGNEWTDFLKFPDRVWTKVEVRAWRKEGRFVARDRRGKEYEMTPEKIAPPPSFNDTQLRALGSEPEEVQVRLFK